MIAQAQRHDQVTVGTVETPWGAFGAVITKQGLARLTFPDEPFERCWTWVRQWAAEGGEATDGEALVTLGDELTAYLRGDLRRFSIPLDPRGTAFQRQVWDALGAIPYGETRSYAWVAARIGRPAAVRAVGLANGANPVPVLVPCHRVIGSNGALTGYGGGLGLKARLLRLEGIAIPARPGLRAHRRPC